MKKLAMTVVLALCTPMAHAAPVDDVDAFDLWNWVTSLFESQNENTANENTSAQLESVQDESRSFTSIIR